MFLVKLYHGQFMPHFWWKQSWVAGGTYSFGEGATESDIWMCIRDTSFCICVCLCKSLPSPTIAKTKCFSEVLHGKFDLVFEVNNSHKMNLVVKHIIDRQSDGPIMFYLKKKRIIVMFLNSDVEVCILGSYMMLYNPQ